MPHLIDQPRFSEILPKIDSLIKNKIIIAYNASFTYALHHSQKQMIQYREVCHLGIDYQLIYKALGIYLGI